MQQMRENRENYVWKHIKNLEELENVRMSAMKKFLADYDTGKADGLYRYHALPDKLPYEDDYLDIGFPISC